MLSFTTQLRVLYAEADRMGYAYYGNYAKYFEVGRVEALRELGVSYKELEDSGIILPVKAFHVDYKKPAYYDDLLTITTKLVKKPAVRIEFEYETRNEKRILLNTGMTELIFFSTKLNKPIHCPDWFLKLLNHDFTV